MVLTPWICGENSMCWYIESTWNNTWYVVRAQHTLTMIITIIELIKKDMCPLKFHNILRYIFKNTRKMTIPVVIVQSFSSSVVSTSLWTHGLQLSLTISWSLLKLMSIESNIMSDCVEYHPTIPSSAVPFSCLQYFPAFGLFKWVSSLYQVAKVLELQLQHQSFQWEYSGLIFFRIDWFDLLAVQGTLQSLLQHHSSQAPILPCSAIFIVQFSHSYMSTGKTIARLDGPLLAKQFLWFLICCLGLS